MLNKTILVLLSFVSLSISADTIEKYVGIAKSIPQSRLKADPKAQAWAHSARTVLDVTEETLAQTIVSMQALSLKQNSPIFCLPNGKSIDTGLVHQILEQSVARLASTDFNKTISEVVVENLASAYPCNSAAKPTSQINSSMFGNSNYQIQSSRK